MNHVRKAIIPAAGFGTRFLPATKAMPKEMLPVVDKPTIQYIVEEAVASGIKDIIIVTGRSKRAIEDHFDKNIELELKLKEKNKTDTLQTLEDIQNLADIHFVRQKEPLGLGHAIWCARKFVGNEPFAVLLGDIIVESKIPCLRQLIDVYDQRHASVLAIEPVLPKDVEKYGIIAGTMGGEGLVEVQHLVEKPQNDPPSNLAIIGRYVLTPSIFAILSNTQPGSGGEIQLTDALNELARLEKVYASRYEGRMYDVGNKIGYLQATFEFACKNQELREEFHQFVRDYLAGHDLEHRSRS